MKRQTSVRVDENFYKNSKKVFDALGLSFGDAVNLFLAQVAIDKKIPFEIRLPSDELKDRINNLENDKNIKTYKCSKVLFNELKI